jgi:hypothetical protein
MRVRASIKTKKLFIEQKKNCIKYETAAAICKKWETEEIINEVEKFSVM